MAEAIAIPVRAALRNIQTRGGQYFRVVFRRKTRGRNGEPVGSIREMTCRRHVRRYVNAITGLGRIIPMEERIEEDRRCQVLTVWDVQVFHELRREGLGLVQAGRNAYRRINLRQVISIEPVRR